MLCCILLFQVMASWLKFQIVLYSGALAQKFTDLGYKLMRELESLEKKNVISLVVFAE